MARAARSVLISAVAGGSPICEINGYPGVRVPRVRSITVANTSAAASIFGLVYALVNGVDAVNTVGALAYFQGGAVGGTPKLNLGTIRTAWATSAPTIANTPYYLRQAVLPAAINAGVTWEFDDVDDLVVLPPAGLTGSLLLWNTGGIIATADLAVTVVFDDGVP